MLSADDGTGHPIFAAIEAVKFKAQNNSELFKVNKLAGVLCRRKRFSGKSMDKVLKEMFRRDKAFLTLSDTCKPLLVPCYDLKSSAPFVFSRAGSPDFNFHHWKVCRATLAIPGLFKPFSLKSIEVQGKTSCSAVDGGLIMNNPTAAAVTHVIHDKRDFPSVNGVEDCWFCR
ncbi:hypothetical protein V6N13_045924 [Hibiscus sabdariffa]|uniref:Patatin n=1 Tax=Hibiscus sabdariffa TaxID=183260 RepID=A0ABR2AY26_9ROSI